MTDDTRWKDGCLAVLAVPVLFLYTGWVTVLMWGWFAVPLGAPSITIAHALGLRLLVGFTTNLYKLEPGKLEKEWDSSAVKWLVNVTLALALGFAVHLSMSLTLVSR